MLTKTVFPLSLAFLLLAVTSSAQAGVIGFLGEGLLNTTDQTVTFDYRLRFDGLGDFSEFTIDVGHSDIPPHLPMDIDFEDFSFEFDALTFANAIEVPFSSGSPIYSLAFDPVPIPITGELEIGKLTFKYGDYLPIDGDTFIVIVEGSTALFDEPIGSLVSFEAPGVGERVVTLPASVGAVPEPASVAIWGLLGVAALGIRRRKK